MLNAKPGCKVLEIGTGSGYQAAVLFKMGCNVYTIERFKGLYQNAKRELSSLFYSIKLFHGDGYLGLPDEAPFDRIIVTAGAAYVPKPLLEQLVSRRDFSYSSGHKISYNDSLYQKIRKRF